MNRGSRRHVWLVVLFPLLVSACWVLLGVGSRANPQSNKGNPEAVLKRINVQPLQRSICEEQNQHEEHLVSSARYFGVP